MTSQIPYADISKALHTDGDWYIISTDDFLDLTRKYDYPHKSIVYHQCRNYWKRVNGSYVYYTPGIYRVSESEFTIPCEDCGSSIPDDLRGLWLLHNFDSIQAEGS
jgi:hypothetical protein